MFSASSNVQASSTRPEVLPEEEGKSPGVVLPVLDSRKLRGLILDECSTIAPRSARTHDDRGAMRNRQEEICRGMYKKQAHAFFEELKDSFGKELNSIRKQAQKSLTKVTLLVDDNDAAAAKMRNVEKVVEELQQSVAQLQTAPTPAVKVAESSKTTSSPALPRNPSPSLSLNRPGRSLRSAESQQQDQDSPVTPPEHERSNKVLSVHLKDLRSVCAEEFGKVSAQLSDNVKKWALEVCTAEIAPHQHELRAEIDVARAGFASEVRDLMHRLDDVGTTQILLGQRVDALEDQHHQDAWKVEQLAEELNGILKIENSELKEKLSAMETRYGGFDHRLDTVENQSEASNMKIRKMMDDLEQALQQEVETRRKEYGHMSSELVMLDARSAAHRDCQATHAQLIQQLELSQQHSEDAERRLWSLQGRRDCDVQDRISKLAIAVQNVQTECAKLKLQALDGNANMENAGEAAFDLSSFAPLPPALDPLLSQNLRMSLDDPFTTISDRQWTDSMNSTGCCSTVISMVQEEDNPEAEEV